MRLLAINFNLILKRLKTTFFAFQIRQHLDDEKWYPAFGGVLRILATLREMGNIL